MVVSDHLYLHRLDLTRMTMTSGLSKKGIFGAVARMHDGRHPTFVLKTSCVVSGITRNSNLVFRVSNPVDRDAMLSLQSALTILIFAILPMTSGLTCKDAVSMVRRVVGVDGDAVHVIACVTPDDPDPLHRPTKVHVRDAHDVREHDVGLTRLSVGQRVYPVFHVTGAAMDASTDHVVPHLTVSDVLICEEGEEGDTPT